MPVIFLENGVAGHVVMLRPCFNFFAVSAQSTIGISLTKHHAGEEKRYDSRSLRRMLETRFVGRKIARLTPGQRSVYYRLDLRRRLTRSAEWATEAIEGVKVEVRAEAQRFLAHGGQLFYCPKGLLLQTGA